MPALARIGGSTAQKRKRLYNRQQSRKRRKLILARTAFSKEAEHCPHLLPQSPVGARESIFEESSESLPQLDRYDSPNPFSQEAPNSTRDEAGGASPGGHVRKGSRIGPALERAVRYVVEWMKKKRLHFTASFYSYLLIFSFIFLL